MNGMLIGPQDDFLEKKVEAFLRGAWRVPKTILKWILFALACALFLIGMAVVMTSTLVFDAESAWK